MSSMIGLTWTFNPVVNGTDFGIMAINGKENFTTTWLRPKSYLVRIDSWSLKSLNLGITTTGSRCGIQAISNHGIAGRGVLLDYYGWRLKQGRPYDPFTSHAIELEELLEVAKSQDVEFHTGDVLLVRSGYTAAYYNYEKSDPSKLEAAGSLTPCLAGVAQTEEMKKWLHDS